MWLLLFLATATAQTCSLCDTCTSCSIFNVNTCPTNSLTISEGATSIFDCKCVPGTFGPTNGQPCQPCQAGTFVSAAGAISCQSCPQGSWCPAGASQPIPCSTCPSNAYASGACTATSDTKCTPCSGYCPAGNYWSTPCSAFGDGVCSQCGLGSLCLGGALQSCPVGFYCPNTTIAMPCPPGFTTSQQGATNEYQCSVCAKGYECAKPVVSVAAIVTLPAPIPDTDFKAMVAPQYGVTSDAIVITSKSSRRLLSIVVNFVVANVTKQPTALVVNNQTVPTVSTFTAVFAEPTCSPGFWGVGNCTACPLHYTGPRAAANASQCWLEDGWLSSTQPCPVRSYCSRGTQTKCPGDSTSQQGSGAWTDCRCPAGRTGTVLGPDNATCVLCSKGNYCPGTCSCET